jgi:aminoglycoside phosphotransferase (APT) family kinase protein
MLPASESPNGEDDVEAARRADAVSRLAGLGDWLAATVDGFAGPVTDVRKLATGRSNLTYVLTGGDGTRYVLRRPPEGVGSSGRGHDVLREARVIDGLGPTGLPVPRVLATCHDAELIGAPFFVMDFVDGAVLTRPTDADSTGLTSDRSRAERATKALVGTLGDIHAVDLTAVGLDDLRRPGTYVERQLRRLGASVAGLPDSPGRDDLLALQEPLRAAAPPEQQVALLHGDYKLGNLMLDPASLSVAAVLDWELCSTGDPLADVGWLIASWAQPEDGRWLVPPATAAGGFPSRDDLAGWLADPTRPARDLDYYVAFAFWRWSAINLGTRRRAMQGTTGGEVDVDALDAQVAWQLSAAAQRLT